MRGGLRGGNGASGGRSKRGSERQKREAACEVVILFTEGVRFVRKNDNMQIVVNKVLG
jgi:hypothetical protein